ncbi:MAG: AtpZ/AtpI family protein [Firmicutes bacterium]|nr:AtpZ/AtpI family protein [Bacillota bacterium]
MALSMATNMAAAVAVGYFFGVFLDKTFGTKPWLTLLMFLLGVATGLKMMYETAFPRGSDESKPGKDNAKKDTDSK